MERVLAAADIGSNTVHLLIARTDGKNITRLINQSEWVALGEAVAREGVVSPQKLNQLLKSLEAFKRACKNYGAERLYVFATEAIRIADNHEEVLAKIRDKTDIGLDVINPRREAELSAVGCQLDSPPVNVLIEVGGGSAQIANLMGTQVVDSVGLPLGSGRLIAEADLSAPATAEQVQRMAEYIGDSLSSLQLMDVDGPAGAVGCGGVIRGLWRALHPDGEKVLSLEELDYLVWSTQRLPVSQTASRFGVKNRRAATLLPGAMVYSAILRHMGLKGIYVSEFGVREGAILEMARGWIEECLV